MNIYGGIDFNTPKQRRLFPGVGLNIDEVCVCGVCVVCVCVCMCVCVWCVCMLAHRHMQT